MKVTSGETIYVRTAGHGPRPVVLLPGNNCSGAEFQALLSAVGESITVRENYTFFAFDYRGSGKSTYVHPIATLEDFARDFSDVVSQDALLQKGAITLVGHSMGFGVAQCMVALDPAKYSGVVSLAGIGTRGVRVAFGGPTAGTDPATGRAYGLGDWADSTSAIAFQQRSWTGPNRTPTTVAATWNFMVFNDILKFDPTRMQAADPTFIGSSTYKDALDDVLTTVYMPESLYASHVFNSTANALEHTNHDGTKVVIPGAGRLAAFRGLKVLLVKAHSDYAAWRGDLVIADSIMQNTKFDLRQAGARVTAILLAAGLGYDHGFPIHHAAETLRLITAFAEEEGELAASRAEAIFGRGAAAVYADAERSWEMEAYGGF